MAIDSRVAVLDKAVTVLDGIADTGAIFKHMPAWRTAQQMESEALVSLLSGQKEHRFAVVTNRVTAEQHSWTTIGADLVTHNLTIELWVAAKMDQDGLRASEATANALRAAVTAAFKPKGALSTGENYCYYAEDGVPQDDGKPELRQLHGVVFNVSRIAVRPREEVARE